MEIPVSGRRIVERDRMGSSLMLQCEMDGGAAGGLGIVPFGSMHEDQCSEEDLEMMMIRYHARGQGDIAKHTTRCSAIGR